MLTELLEGVAARFGDRVALACDQGEITYGELRSRASGLSAWLAERGVEPQSTVGVSMAPGPHSVVALFALGRLGCRVLLLDPGLKPAEVVGYCSRAGAAVLLQPPGVLATPEQEEVEVWELPEPAAEAGPPPPAAGAPVLLFLSSGTSGPPKIVMRTASQTAAAVRNFTDTVELTPEDRILAVLPFFHTFGLANVLLGGLSAGATLMPGRFAPRDTLRQIAQERVTVLPATPFMFRLMAATRVEPVPDMSSVRLAISAGSALAPAVRQAFLDRYGIGVRQSYGTTESGPVALTDAEGDDGGPACVGRLYEGVQVAIVGTDGRPVDEGDSGAVAVLSEANASGYLYAGPAAAGVFRDGMVYTGDVGRIDSEGRLHILGRNRPLLNVAGKKVAAAEVEACLRGHPAVTDVVVMGEPASDGSDIIKAVVSVASPVDAGDLRAFCAERIADFKVPRRIEFVDSLSTGPMGKANLPT
jgi:long-chain acyl-CoA synthetase